MSKILRYGVLSDTHGALHPGVFDVFTDLIRIYHCGDVGSASCLEDLEVLGPVRAVHGNMDSWPVSGNWPEELVETEGFGKVVVYHGACYSHSNDTIILGLTKRFNSSTPRLFLFGHSHQPCVEEHNGILFVNPGSVTFPLRGETASVALVEYDTDQDLLTARIVSLEEP
ncbi:metallophosphoesterase family protein [bacterium]|nr:metallophosphoesterase family protein [bacterium]